MGNQHFELSYLAYIRTVLEGEAKCKVNSCFGSFTLGTLTQPVVSMKSCHRFFFLEGQYGAGLAREHLGLLSLFGGLTPMCLTVSTNPACRSSSKENKGCRQLQITPRCPRGATNAESFTANHRGRVSGLCTLQCVVVRTTLLAAASRTPALLSGGGRNKGRTLDQLPLTQQWPTTVDRIWSMLRLTGTLESSTGEIDPSQWFFFSERYHVTCMQQFPRWNIKRLSLEMIRLHPRRYGQQLIRSFHL